MCGFVDRAAARFGHIDHCIAGTSIMSIMSRMSFMVEASLTATTDAEIAAMLQENLAGSIVLVRECVRRMLGRPPADEAREPSIVVISASVAARGSSGSSVYAATQAGLDAFARCLAGELGGHGIRVNAVATGVVETELPAPLPPARRERIARHTALGRLGVPADVVGAIDWLTSPAAAFITGQVVTIDGGS